MLDINVEMLGNVVGTPAGDTEAGDVAGGVFSLRGMALCIESGDSALAL